MTKWSTRFYKSPSHIIEFFFPSRKFFFSGVVCSSWLTLVSDPLEMENFVNRFWGKNMKQSGKICMLLVQYFWSNS